MMETVMLKVNEYFEGTVKSIAFENSEGKATAGVISPGDYEFGTSTVEVMSIASGNMEVQFANDAKWHKYTKKQNFTVEANSKFKVRCSEDCAYVCFYK
jgi:purine/pyrimidine-nucleoside phosphorylase